MPGDGRASRTSVAADPTAICPPRTDPAFDPPAGALTPRKHLDAACKRVQGLDTVVARITAELIERICSLNATIAELGDELDARTAHAAPSLRSVHGVGPLTAAKTIGETAGVGRFTPGTHTPATTAPRRCRCGPPTPA